MKRFFLINLMLSLWFTGMFSQSAGSGEQFSEALRVVDAWLDAQVDYQQIPGISAAFIVDQELVWTRGTGLSDLGLGSATTDSTIYSICSISKIFTAIGVLQLRDRGLLDLDDDIHEHLPWLDLKQAYPDGGPLTIRALLTHSAGVPRDGIPPYWADAEFPFPSKEEFREGLSSQETLYPPSAAYQYSNLGISLLGMMIEELSGQDFESYMQEHILEVLGMSDTRPEMPETLRKGRLATGYGVVSREGERDELNFFQAGGIAPAAGFSSTVKDMAAFASWNFRALEIPDNPVLNGNTLREMQRIQYVDPIDGITRGLGYGVYRDQGMHLVGHAGECPGYYSQFKLEPEKKWGVTLMFNALGVSSSKLMYGIFKILDSYDKSSPVALPGDVDLEDYAGSYYDIWDGESLVVPWKGKLAVFSLRSGTQGGPSTLAVHEEGDRFRQMRSDGSPGAEICFERDSSGQVTKYWVHSFYMEKLSPEP